MIMPCFAEPPLSRCCLSPSSFCFHISRRSDEAGIPKEDEGFHLMLWVIAQNGAVGAFSWVSGIIADRYGNRLAIRIQVFLCTLTPLMALFLISDFI